MGNDLMLKGVKKIIRVQHNTDNSGLRLVVFKEGRKRRRGTKALRPIEKALRRSVRGQKIFADSYLDRHEKSSKKKRNGWMRDMHYNVMRAGLKSAKVLRLR